MTLVRMAPSQRRSQLLCLRPCPSCPLVPGLECRPPALCLRKTDPSQRPAQLLPETWASRSVEVISRHAELLGVAKTWVSCTLTRKPGVAGTPGPPVASPQVPSEHHLASPGSRTELQGPEGAGGGGRMGQGT